MRFLSDRSIEMHKEHYNTLTLRYKVFEKSYPEIKDKGIREIYRCSVPLSEKREAVRLYSDILAHKIYFSSFGARNAVSRRVKDEYASVASFLYLLSEECMKCREGFLLIYENRGKISTYCGDEYDKVLLKNEALLALDLYEHAYFLDYGFDREKYVLNAISHLDLEKIEKSAN